MSRFTKSTAENINEFINRSKNTNTTKATSQWIRLFQSWTLERNMVIKIEELDAPELDKILQQFYSEVVKQNGDDYEPSSLANLQAGIDRYLKEKSYKFSIIRDREFATSRSVLEGKARILREKGKGKKPNKAASLDNKDEDVLWKCGQLGSSTPMSIINTIWWQFTQHFGLRGRQEHHSMQVEDFSFRMDDNGVEYLTFAEGITKTRQSGLHEKHRLVQPKMFATNTSQCPVSFYKLYLSKRPISLRATGPLYLSVIHNPASSIWYKNMPMGQHTINVIMKKMVENSPLANSTKRLTNHSARKTVVKKLKQNHIPKSEIIGITGHTTEAGLDAYDSGDESEQRSISHAIENISGASVATTSKQQRQFHPSDWLISPSNPLVQQPSFNLFTQKLHQSPIQSSSSTFNFNNCSVNIYGTTSQNNTKKRKRYNIISSSDSSQE